MQHANVISRNAAFDVPLEQLSCHNVDFTSSNRIFSVLQNYVIYVAAKATYIRLLLAKWRFFGPSSVKRGRTNIVLG